MRLIGTEFIASLAQRGGFEAKLVVNEHGAIFFPVHEQHRHQKAPGISYEDDYAGNALAAMMSPGRIDIRFHRDFPIARVASILAQMLSQPRLKFARGYRVTYQGHALPTGSAGLSG